MNVIYNQASGIEPFTKEFIAMVSTRAIMFLTFVFVLTTLPKTIYAQASRESATATDLKQLESLIRELALEHIPHKYEKKKNWGNQTERWDGLHIQLKGLKLKTKRRKKSVNDGTWKHYSAELVDPKNGVDFHLHSIKKISSGKARIELSVAADLKLFGRISNWVKGVQLFSFSVDGKARVALRASMILNTRFDFNQLPPDVVLNPKVESAKLEIQSFQIKRISKAGGEVAQQVGRGVKSVLDDKVHEQEQKLVAKMNRSIEKKKDRLRLSTRELIDSEWEKLAESLLPMDDSKSKE